jgi:photosystem II stability/assembly factor-like uncharacterized protein
MGFRGREGDESFRVRALLIVAFALVSGAAFAGPWSPVGPSDGQYQIATHPTTAGVAMISGGYGSLSTWFTKDGGATWIGNPWRGATGRPVLSGSPTVAWMIGSGLLRSVDEGRSWGIVDPGGFGITMLDVNPTDPDEVIIAGSDGTRHSRDGGATWVAGPAAGDVYAMAVDWSTRRLYVIAYTTVGIEPALRRRLLDGPDTWTTIAIADSVAATRGIVLASKPSGGLIRSADGGDAFAPVVTAVPIRPDSIVLAPGPVAATHRAYAISNELSGPRVMRSDDDGATWVPLPSLSIDPSVRATLAIDAGNANRVYVMAGRGLLVSNDGGASFQAIPRATGVPAGTQRIVFDAVDPLRQWTMGPADGFVSGIPRSTDGGATWAEIAPTYVLLGASRSRTNTLFGANVFGTGVALSRDGGNTWTPKTSNSYWFGPLGYGAAPGEIYIVDRGSGYSQEAIFASADDGESFVSRPAPPILPYAFASSAGSPSTLYVAGAPNVQGGAQLWRSVDRAVSWQPVHVFPHPWIPGPSYGNPVVAIAVDPADPNRLYAGLALPDHLMRSVDGGATWQRSTVGLGAGAITSITFDPSNASIVYAAQLGSGVFRSTDRGATWTALDQGLRDDAVRQVVLNPHVPGALYAGTDSGLWRTNLLTGFPTGYRRAIEFYHGGFDHYFVSADADEITGLDAGVFAGWVRTGEGFRVAEGTSSGNAATCRFFSVGFGAVSSHFYTPYPQECDIVKADPNWVYEKIAFGLALPDPATRGCPSNTRPLYRAWNRNQGGAPNHRYNTDLWSIVNSVLRQGWILEGDIKTLVFACVPVE